jgi:hypothetical protein
MHFILTLRFYKMRFFEDGASVEVALYQEANSATTNYFTFIITNFQLNSKTRTLTSRCYITKEPSFLELRN